jgi:hypothetical protein
VEKQIEQEQTFNFDLAQETPGQASMTVKEHGDANMEMVGSSRLDRVACRGLEKWRLASTLMCIKRGIHGGRSSDACAHVSAVETHHHCDDNEVVVVMRFFQQRVCTQARGCIRSCGIGT